MGNKDMRSEINQVHQIFATLMGFIGVILAFLVKLLVQNPSIKSLFENGNITDLFHFLLFFSIIVLLTAPITVILLIWLNKIIEITYNYKEKINLSDILLSLNSVYIILSILSIIFIYFSLSLISNKISLLLIVLMLYSILPAVFFFEVLRTLNRKLFLKYFNIKTIITSFLIFILILIFLNHIIKIISIAILISIISIISILIFYPEFILLHENISNFNNNIILLIDSSSTSFSENNTSKSKIATKNDSTINPIHSGISIASLIVLIIIILTNPHLENLDLFWKAIIVVLLGLVISGLCK